MTHEEAAADYELAASRSDSHLRALGHDPADPAVNTGAILRRLALRGDETALNCLIAELVAASRLEEVLSSGDEDIWA